MKTARCGIDQRIAGLHTYSPKRGGKRANPMTTRPTPIVIDLSDVEKHGGVNNALKAYCEESETTSCGVVGPAFTTSGPGPGWSRYHDESDFASRAMEGGALYYLDLDDGRIAFAPAWEDDLYDGQEIVWTSESMVRIECPDMADAARCPDPIADMARAVIDTHGPLSDRAAWAKLIREMRAIGGAVPRIDIVDDDLD